MARAGAACALGFPAVVDVGLVFRSGADAKLSGDEAASFVEAPGAAVALQSDERQSVRPNRLGVGEEFAAEPQPPRATGDEALRGRSSGGIEAPALSSLALYVVERDN